MDKIRNILFLIFQKTASGISFVRLIHVSLITAPLVLAACSSNPIPLATATATPEATTIYTATLTPTPTAVEITPTLVEGAVVTDKGSVFVENGTYMLIDKKGIKKEIKDISTEITFNSVKDASNTVFAMHAAEFANQEALHTILSVPKNSNYLQYINSVVYSGSVDEGTYVSTVGLPAEYIKVKSPLGEAAKFPEVGMAMLEVYGDERPVPMILGIFDTQGNFAPFYDTISENEAETYPVTKKEIDAPQLMHWDAFQKLIGDNIVSTSFLYEIMPTTSAKFTEPEGDNNPANHLSIAAKQERKRLLQLNLKQGEAGYQYMQGRKDRPKLAGNMYADLESLLPADQSFFFFTRYGYLQIILRSE
jgi:hypothetical protein